VSACVCVCCGRGRGFSHILDRALVVCIALAVSRQQRTLTCNNSKGKSTAGLQHRSLLSCVQTPAVLCLQGTVCGGAPLQVPYVQTFPCPMSTHKWVHCHTRVFHLARLRAGTVQLCDPLLHQTPWD
jgi:hypothetical protein